MDDKRISPEQLKAAMAGEMDQLFVHLAEAMNQARDGHIIADSEEPVRDAHAEFREKAYQAMLDLLQHRQEAFSPSAPGAAEQGQTEDDASDGQRPG